MVLDGTDTDLDDVGAKHLPGTPPGVLIERQRSHTRLVRLDDAYGRTGSPAIRQARAFGGSAPRVAGKSLLPDLNRVMTVEKADGG